MKKKTPLSELDTYIYIDASNIRAACLKTLKLKIDFRKLIKYFRNKYPRLQETRYYEGVADDDSQKKQHFSSLKRAGYTVCSLSRKTYIDPAMYKEVKCKKCGNVQKVQTLKRSIKMKSNVDVYLATDLLETAYLAKKPVHIILASCDGDYAEMIKNAIIKNKNVTISVLATPAVKDYSRNTLSVRLKELRNSIPRFHLTDVRDICDLIKGE